MSWLRALCCYPSMCSQLRTLCFPGLSGYPFHHCCLLCLQILRWVLIGICYGNLGLMLVASLLRLFEKTGKIRQADMDALVAEKLANQEIAKMQRQFGNQEFGGWGGVERYHAKATQEQMAK